MAKEKNKNKKVFFGYSEIQDGGEMVDLMKSGGVLVRRLMKSGGVLC